MSFGSGISFGMIATHPISHYVAKPIPGFVKLVITFLEGEEVGETVEW